jgi:transcriptional regulator with XRE-family HTH domain
MHIHDKLKFLRTFKGWSQEELANKLGLSVNGYAKIERGESEVNLTRLEQIAETLGTDLTQLLSLNEGSVFNVMDNCTTSVAQGYIVLSETQCAHELEKAQLLLAERGKEIENLKKQIAQLENINRLLQEGK